MSGLVGAKNKIVLPLPDCLEGLFHTQGNRCSHNNGVCAKAAIQFFKLSGNIFRSENGCISAEFPGELPVDRD